MMDAEERRLAGRDDDDDSEKSDSDDLGPVDDAEKETYPCVVAAKYPLFEATFELSALHMRIKATGKRGEGRQSINLNTCRFDQALTRECSSNWLEFLPIQIAHFAFDNLWEQLGLQRTPEEARTPQQLDSIRLNYIAQRKDGGHAQTLEGLLLSLIGCKALSTFVQGRFAATSGMESTRKMHFSCGMMRVLMILM